MSTNGTLERMARVLEAAPAATVEDSWERKLEAGLRAAQQVEQERDMAAKALADCRVELRGLNAEHNALRIAFARAQGEVESYRYDRDVAIAKRAAADVLIEAVLTLLAKHRATTLANELDAVRVGAHDDTVTSPLPKDQPT